MNPNIDQQPISIDSMLSYRELVNKPQKHQEYFFGIRKFILTLFGKQFNPPLQPTFRSEVHGERAVLPPELWMRIFHHVKSDALEDISSTHLIMEHECIKLRATKLHLAPTLFRPVCRYWNVMITSNPLFWNTISVYMISQSPERHLSTWLERSGQAPVSIFFDARSLVFDFHPNSCTWRLDEGSFKKCVSILHQHAPRIQSLYVSLCDDAAKVWAEMLPPSPSRTSEELDPSQPDECLNLNFRMLQAVGIRVAGRGYSHLEGGRSAVEQELVYRLCSHTTSIISLHLGDRYMDLPTFRDNPFRSQILACPSITGIVSLTLTNVNIEPGLSTFLQNLSRLLCLRMLWLDCVMFDRLRFARRAADQPVRITLRNLQELRLSTAAVHTPCRSATHYPISPFLERISVPNLTALEIDSKWFDHSSDWTTLEKALTVSRCTIRSLTLISDDESFCYFEAVCISSQVFSELEELVLKPRVWMKKAFIRHLGGLQDRLDSTPGHYQITLLVNRCTLPRLKSLTLHGCLVEEGLLGHIARIRMQGGTLNYFYAEVKDLHPETHPKDIETFKELRKLGYRAYLEGVPQSVLRTIDRYKTESQWWSKEVREYMDVP